MGISTIELCDSCFNQNIQRSEKVYLSPILYHLEGTTREPGRPRKGV